jgi:hypothetical protein
MLRKKFFGTVGTGSAKAGEKGGREEEADGNCFVVDFIGLSVPSAAC